MGKKKARRIAGINKSAEVRKYLGESPGAPPTQVVEAMKERGFDVSVSLVTQVKSRLGGGRRRRSLVTQVKSRLGGGRRRRRKKVVRRPVAAKPAVAARDGLSVDDLLEAKKLADQLGGVKQAKKALDTLEQLQ